MFPEITKKFLSLLIRKTFEASQKMGTCFSQAPQQVGRLLVSQIISYIGKIIWTIP